MLIDLLYRAVERPAFVIHGVRKIVQGLYYEHEGPLPAKDILKDLGYTSAKVTRLTNVYYNAEEVEKARAKLAQREGEEHSSVSILTRNVEKTHRATQGWCIQNVTLSETWRKGKRIVTSDVFYRSTELIQKFGADLSLINRIYADVGVEPSITRMYFANAYVSAVFFPVLFQFHDGVHFLKHVAKHDKQFHFLSCKAISRYLDPTNRYTYRAQVKQWERARSVDRAPIDEYLMSVIGEYHAEHLPAKPRRAPTKRVARG